MDKLGATHYFNWLHDYYLPNKSLIVLQEIYLLCPLKLATFETNSTHSRHIPPHLGSSSAPELTNHNINKELGDGRTFGGGQEG